MQGNLTSHLGRRYTAVIPVFKGRGSESSGDLIMVTELVNDRAKGRPHPA
jgi:hypothetical protein